MTDSEKLRASVHAWAMRDTPMGAKVRSLYWDSMIYVYIEVRGNRQGKLPAELRDVARKTFLKLRALGDDPEVREAIAELVQ